MKDFWKCKYKRERIEKEKWKAKYEVSRRLKLCEIHNEIYKLFELNASVTIPEEVVVKNDSMYEILNRELALKISEQVVKHMETFTEYDPFLKNYVIKARLKVVDK